MAEIITCPLSKGLVCDVPKTRVKFLKDYKTPFCVSEKRGSVILCLPRETYPEDINPEVNRSCR